MIINALAIGYVIVSSTIIVVQKKKLEDCKELVESAKKNID